MKKIPLLILILYISVISYSQQLRGDIEVFVRNIIEEMPGSNGNHYRDPTLEELEKWETCLQAFLDGNLDFAFQNIDELNYQILEFKDTTENKVSSYFAFLEKSVQTNYWGTYIFSVDPLRKDLIIQTPHPIYDANTGYQGVYCFKRLSAGALFLSGTHRCNSSISSTCSGTTSACSSVNAPYRISDNAHNANSIFQITTEIVFRTYEHSMFVQLHGFAKKESDPYVILSNGTRVSPEVDYLSLIRDQLSIADPGLTFKLANYDLDWNRLIAFTNTQGRFINGSPNPCNQSATKSEGRFIHIEQEKIKLRQSPTSWNKMLFALSNVFQVDTATYIRNLKTEDCFSIFPNPTTGFININTNGPSRITLYNNGGAIILSKQIVDSDERIEVSSLKSGIYVMKIETRTKIYFEKVIVL